MNILIKNIQLKKLNQKKISPEIEKLDTIPMPYVTVSVLLFGGLMYLFKKKYSEVEQGK
jgi:hypothetical protein